MSNPHDKPDITLAELKGVIDRKRSEYIAGRPKWTMYGYLNDCWSDLKPSGLRRRVRGESPEEKKARKYYKFKADRRRLNRSCQLMGLLVIPTIMFGAIGYFGSSTYFLTAGGLSLAAWFVMLGVSCCQPVCSGGAAGPF